MKWFNSDAIIPAGLAFFAGMGWAYFTVHGQVLYGSVDWVAFGSVVTALVFVVTAYNIVYLPWRNKNHAFRCFVSELLINAALIDEVLNDYKTGKTPAPQILLPNSYKFIEPFIGALGADTLKFADLCQQVLRTERNWDSVVSDITRELDKKGDSYKGSEAEIHNSKQLERSMKGLDTARTSMRTLAKKLSENPLWRAT